MNARKLKIAYEDTPEEFEKYLQNESSDNYGLLNFVVRAMRFSYDYHSVKFEFSQLLPNGTWTGSIGLLNRSEVDIVPAPFIVTEERWDAVAFNYPYIFDDITFISRNPSYRPEIMAIFLTLSASVWLSLLISIVLVTLVFFMVLKYRYTLDDVILNVLAIGLNQEGYIIPKKAGEVLLICTWMLGMMLFTPCFKSVLLSFLSFPPLTGVRTVPELADAIRVGKYSAMTMENDFLPMFLQESPVEDIRLIGENILKTPPGIPKDLFNKSHNPNLISVYYRSDVKYLEEKLHVSEDSMGFYMTATAVSKDFCCREQMDMIIHRFLAAGIDLKINRFSDFQNAFKYFSDIPEDDVARKITLTDISGAFIFLVAGYCLSAFGLIIEMMIKSREMLLFSAI